MTVMPLKAVRGGGHLDGAVSARTAHPLRGGRNTLQTQFLGKQGLVTVAQQDTHAVRGAGGPSSSRFQGQVIHSHSVFLQERHRGDLVDFTP